MPLEHFRELLLAKEKELLSDLAHTGAEVPDDLEKGGQDEMDVVVQSEAKDLLMDRKSYQLNILDQVRAALRRLEEGTYGECQYCGQPIEPKRLEAVPWAEFDLEHQELQDRKKPL